MNILNWRNGNANTTQSHTLLPAALVVLATTLRTFMRYQRICPKRLQSRIYKGLWNLPLQLWQLILKNNGAVTAREKRRQGRSLESICNLEYQGEEARGLASKALNTGFRLGVRSAEIT